MHMKEAIISVSRFRLVRGRGRGQPAQVLKTVILTNKDIKSIFKGGFEEVRFVVLQGWQVANESLLSLETYF